MKRNLKALGLSLVAVFAMSAMVAQAASADPLFKSDEAHTIIKGSQEGTHEFVAGEGKVTCTTANFAGTSEEKAQNSLTIIPEYKGCTAFGFATTDVKFAENGCEYVFTSTTGEGEDVHLLCSGEKNVELTPTVFGFSVCTVDVLPGTFESVTYDNVENGDVTVTAEAAGISYEEVSGDCGIGSGENGTYTGNATMAGTDTDENPVDIEVG